MSEGTGTPGPGPDEHVVRVRVTGPDAAALRSFIEQSGADVSCRPVAVRTDGGVAAQVLLTRAGLDAARGSRAAGGIELEEIEDVTEGQRAARSAVGTGDRYASRGAVPRGLGRKE